MKATSSAVRLEPSWNFTPCRILKVHTEASEFADHDVASLGCRCRFWSDHTRYSLAWPSTARPPSSATFSGSIAPAGEMTATVILPPFLVPVVVVPVDVPQAARMAPMLGRLRPSTVARRTNSRRDREPLSKLSIRWLSSSE